MNNFSISSSDSPGLTLPKLMQQAKPDDLCNLIDASIIDFLKGLDPELVRGERFSDFVAKYMDPVATLRDSHKRNQIIKLLPWPKACELAERLGIKVNNDLYRNIQTKVCSKDELDVVLSFFGIGREDKSPIHKRAPIETINAQYNLFDHQNAVAMRAERILSEPPHKAVLHMPTGSGKTRTAMHIIASHLKHNNPTLVFWLAQSSELLDQAANEFESAWHHLGNRPISLVRFWGHYDANIMSVHDGVVVAGLGKMHALDKRKPNEILCVADRTSMVVIDEAHQAIAPTYQSVLDVLHTKRPNSALLGLTATPGRTWSDIEEDKKLADYFDNQKITLQVKGFENDPIGFLVSEGYLAKPHFQTLDYDAGITLSDEDNHKLNQSIEVPDNILKQLGNDVRRNIKIIKIIEELISRHRKVIVFTPSVENAKLLYAVLIARNHEAHIVTSQTNKQKRERTIQRFKSNTDCPMVIVNYGVLTTGFDVPEVSAAIIARPTKSLVLYSQMVGRAIRGPKAGGNMEAEIVTIVDLRLPGFSDIATAFNNWEDVWHESK